MSTHKISQLTIFITLCFVISGCTSGVRISSALFGTSNSQSSVGGSTSSTGGPSSPAPSAGGSTGTTSSGTSSLPAPAAQSSISQAYHVNCDLGSGGSGTASSPFGSLAQAQSAMQNSSVKTTIVSGTCTLTSNWNFTSADANETWEAECGQVATISGGNTCTVNQVPVNVPGCQGRQPTTSSGCYNINGSGANNLSFYGFTFAHLAAETSGSSWYDGLNLADQNGGSVRWNTFNSCTTSCVSGYFSSNLVIDSNTLNNETDGYPSGFDITTTQGTDGLCFVPTAIGVGANTSPTGATGNIISNNLINNAQGGGISFIGNNTIISNNIIQNAGQEVFDGGAIYGSPAKGETGVQITNNTITNFGGAKASSNWTHAMYLDDGVSNVLISGNIIQTANAGSLFMIHGGDNVTITNNIFDLSTGGAIDIQPDGVTDMNGNNFSNNVVYSSGGFAGVFGNLSYNPNDYPLTGSNDIFYATSSPSTVPSGAKLTSPSTINPQFANPGSYNYSIGNSAIYNTGFKALNTNRGPSSNAVCPGGY